jgi:hypothetical protein
MGGKPTGGQIDRNLVIDEALRTQMAQNQKEQDEKMAAPQARKIAARAQPDQRAKIIAAQQKKPGRHPYSTLPKFTAENAPASGKIIPQMKEPDRTRPVKAPEAAPQKAAAADPGPKIIAAQQKKPGRNSYSSLPKFTAGNIDSSATTQPQSAPAIVQAKAVERQTGQQIHARNTEIARAQNEGDLQKWRLNWFKFKFR